MSDVYVYVYDLTKGLAKQLSMAFLGRQFDGIWHTGIVAFGQEWYFGSGGIDSCPPKGTMLGEPDQMIKLGRTEMSEIDFFEILRQLSESSFKLGTYKLLEHNCNNFSNELAQIVVGKPIPAHILDLPGEILSTPMGGMLRAMLEQAADPVQASQHHATPAFLQTGPSSSTTSSASFSSPTSSAASSRAAASEQQQNQKPTLPNTATVFRPDIKSDVDKFLNDSHLKNMVSLSEQGLLREVGDACLDDNDSSPISADQIKLMFELILSKLSTRDQKVILLKMLQLLCLRPVAAKLAVASKHLFADIVPRITSQEVIVQSNILQMLSNICTHRDVTQLLLEKHQEELASGLSDFLIVNEQTKADIVYEAAISLFFNLTCVYHQEKLVNDTSALALGCALMETMRMHRTKQARTAYQMLFLLRTLLSQSSDMKEYALSVGGDLNLNEYHSKTTKESASSPTNCDKLIADIEEILK